MTTRRSSLATEVIIHRPNGVVRSRDLPLHIDTNARGITTLIIGSWSDERVEVKLTEAERISLIEALGGVKA